jgi:predicted glycosyltransferase
MKILYAVQGTGNGHITRAIEIIPYLKQRSEVDILVSGIQSDIELPFKVTYRFNGLSFI